MLDGLEVLYVDRVESRHPVRLRSIIGTRNPLHCTSLGKAILAFLPPDEQAALVPRLALTRHTTNTITDADVLQRHLACVRERGYAIDDIENEDGVRCLGVPIRDHTGRAFAALSIAGPAYRFSLERIAELAPAVMRAAAEISCRVGFVPATA